MDDTVAMQDTNNRISDSACRGAGSVHEQTAVIKGCSPAHSSSALPQQVADTSSVKSDNSSQEQPNKQSAGQYRSLHGSVDVDAAKQAALSALAGLDLTTTKANLDASKAAAATARANGEVPIHTRKSSLRSVSCRQLGTSATSSTPTAGKTVAFDDASKVRAGLDGVRPAPGQWRGGAADGLTRNTSRAPASRCISLPHVLQGRAGMASRLAASYAQDVALQQQLQLLGGASGVGQQFTALSRVQSGGTHNMDTLFQLKQQLQQQAVSTPGTLSAQQRTLAVPGMRVFDDSVLPVQTGNIMLQSSGQQPLQQLQPQQARLTPTWNAASATQTQLPHWAAGQANQQGLAQTANANVQLLAHLQATSQGQATGDALWMAPSSTALQLTNSRPQGMITQQNAEPGSMAGIAGLQQQQLIAAQPQPSASVANAGAGTQPAAVTATAGNTLLEKYESVSWSVLAAAQGEAGLNNQLLTELVLLLTLLHTLNNVLKGSMSVAEAMGDFNYLASAARHHMASFSQLSQAGNVAVQLMAVITPLALWHLQSTELIEAAFLVLDTLALASRDVATVISHQRMAAIASLNMQLPVEQVLQQQALGLQWIAGLASAVSRNKAVLESLATEASSQGVTATGAQIGLAQATAGMSGARLMPGGGLALGSSQPLVVPPTSSATAALHTSALSPSRKTPLATYFEERLGGQASTAAGTATASASGGNPSGLMLTAGTFGQSLNDQLMAANGITGVQLSGAAAQESIGARSDLSAAAAAAGDLSYAGLDKLTGLSLSVLPSQQGAAADFHGAGAAGAVPGSRSHTYTYSSVGGGLSLFSDVTLLGPGSNGPNSAGASRIAGM